MSLFKDTRLIYLCDDGFPKTVIDSQVIGLLESMQRKGFCFDYFNFEGLRPALRNFKRNQQVIRTLKSRLSGRIIKPISVKLNTGPGIIFSLVNMVILLSKDMMCGKKILIHARGNQSAYLAIRFKRLYKKAKVLFDIRGDVGAEFLYLLEKQDKNVNNIINRWQFLTIKRREKAAVEEADKIFCVSNVFRNHLQRQYDIPADKLEVIPCFASAEIFFYDAKLRTAAREKLGLKDAQVLIYIGSLLEWQLFDVTADLFNMVRQIKQNSHLIVLTPHADKAKRILTEKEISDKNYRIISVGYNEVPEYLMAADTALLLRERHPLNKVACPTKFAEYIMCGLPTVITRNIGDLAEVVEANNMGYVLNEAKDWKELEKAARHIAAMTHNDEDRYKISSISKALFSKEIYADRIAEVYSSLRN